MRKKYLSRILLGGLLVASTVAITSCKDYDDDIDDLQSQITSLSSSLSSLQSEVDAGNYVTNVSKSGSTITITWSSGSTSSFTDDDTITEDTGSIVTVVDGYLYIDGEKTDIAVVDADAITEDASSAAVSAILSYITVTDEGVYIGDQLISTASGSTVTVENGYILVDEEIVAELPSVIVKDGYWATLQEDGTYASTGVPVSNVYVTGSDADGYVLNVYDEDGNLTQVELPTASSLVSSIEYYGDDIAYPELEYGIYDFDPNNSYYNSTTTTNAAQWKSLTGTSYSDAYIVSPVNDPAIIQINPTSIDAEDLDLYLIDSQNKSGLDIDVESYSGLIYRYGRAANGLYNISLTEQTYTKNSTYSSEDVIESILKGTYYDSSVSDYKAYAVTANGTVRSKYMFWIDRSSDLPEVTTATFVKSSSETYDITTSGDVIEEGTISVDLGTYSIVLDDEDAVKDTYLYVDSNNTSLYGVELDQENLTVTITDTPDNQTKYGFYLYVYVLEKDGDIFEATFWIGLSAKLSDTTSYGSVTHEITDDSADDNFFAISLSSMKNSLSSSNLNIWNLQVDNYAIASIVDSNGNSVTSEALSLASTTEGYSSIESTLTKTLAKNVDLGSGSDNYIVFDIDNSKADLTIDETYTVTVEFYDEDGDVLTSLVFELTLTLPDIEEVFDLDEEQLVDGVYLMYLRYDDVEENQSVKLSRIFSQTAYTGTPIADTTGGFTITLDNSTYGNTYGYVDVTAESASAPTVGNLTSTITSTDIAYVNITKKYYGENINLTISGSYLNCWAYPEEQVLEFTIAIKSPIKEGKITAADGSSTVTLAASGGYAYVTNSDITGYTYNSLVTYNVLPDLYVDGTTLDWERDDVASITAASSNTNYFTVEEITAATQDSDGNTVDGQIVLKPGQTSGTVSGTLKVTLTDVWGYSLTQELNVSIEVE